MHNIYIPEKFMDLFVLYVVVGEIRGACFQEGVQQAKHCICLVTT